MFMFQISFRSLRCGTGTGFGPGPDSVSVQASSTATSSSFIEHEIKNKVDDSEKQAQARLTSMFPFTGSSRPHCFTFSNKIAEVGGEPG